MGHDESPPELACVILAHGDPAQVHRLVEALDPFPVFVHVDSRASDEMFEAISAGLPARARILPRKATAWATWGIVEAEFEGYRAALALEGITHVALLSGADYPLASSDEIRDILRAHRDDSFGRVDRLPYDQWGRSGGFDRLRYRHWAFRKRMLRLPIPRRLPRGVDFAGGSLSKILAVAHVRALVETYDSRPDLVTFWRRSWTADETFVNSLLNTPSLVPGWRQNHVNLTVWWINWSGPRKKSPPWVQLEVLPSLLQRRWDDAQEVPFLFARKFSTAESTPVMDELDEAHGLRGRGLERHGRHEA